MIRDDLYGSWTLESFDIEALDGKVAPWGRNAHGLLLYDKSGNMSASINRALEEKFDVPEKNIFDSILFYSGTYTLHDGNEIRHQVKNASNPTRIGREMIRYAEFNGSLLTLVTPKESFGRAILKWRKVK